MKKLVFWTLIIGVIAYGAAKWYMHSEVSNAMDTGVLMMSPYATIEYKSVSSTMSGKPTFIISAQPIEPVNLSQIGLYKPTDVPALLNLSQTTR